MTGKDYNIARDRFPKWWADQVGVTGNWTMLERAAAMSAWFDAFESGIAHEREAQKARRLTMGEIADFTNDIRDGLNTAEQCAIDLHAAQEAKNEG